jgi:hypothetical protein
MSLSVTSDWFRLETFVQRSVAQIACFSLVQDASDQKQERATRGRPIQDSTSISHEGYVEDEQIVTRIAMPQLMAIQENLRRMSYGN